jgi:branched-chain amino acid transport system permease protein
MKVVQSSRQSRAAAVAFLLLILVLASAPMWASRGHISLLIEFLYFLALAQIWNLLAGFAGIVSLGQQAFLGLGGYALFFVTMHWQVNPVLSLILAAIAGGIIAIPVTFVVFRLHGAYLAIGTWVMAEVFKLVFSNVNSLGAGSGISLPSSVAHAVNFGSFRRDTTLYCIALGVALLSILCTYALLRSQVGLELSAIRDDETAARSAGVSSFRIKLLVFIAAGAATAMTGALIYLSKLRISPNSAFDINWTSSIIFIVVIGGLGTLEGPMVGAIVFFVLRQYLSDLGSWYLIVLGAVAVAVMLKMPSGIWGSLAKRYSLSLFPTQRRLVLSEKEVTEEVIHSQA